MLRINQTKYFFEKPDIMGFFHTKTIDVKHQVHISDSIALNLMEKEFCPIHVQLFGIIFSGFPANILASEHRQLRNRLRRIFFLLVRRKCFCLLRQSPQLIFRKALSIVFQLLGKLGIFLSCQTRHRQKCENYAVCIINQPCFQELFKEIRVDLRP